LWLSRAGREVKETETDKVIFILTKEDVQECAREMGIPAETITQDVLARVKKGVEWGLECWSEVMKEAIDMALKS
jgi:hypothetical protein